MDNEEDNTNSVPIGVPFDVQDDDNNAMLGSTSKGNNPTGKNHHIHCRTSVMTLSSLVLLILLPAPPGDERLKQLLTSYHTRGITDRKVITKLLVTEVPSIKMRYVYIYITTALIPTW